MRRTIRKKYICIVCPVGCAINVALKGQKILKLHGARCPKGEVYVKGEVTHPCMDITTTVLVRLGNLDLASVRTRSAIPRGKLLRVMNILAKKTVNAPISAGDIIAKNIAGTGVDVIATKNILKSPSKRK